MGSYSNNDQLHNPWTLLHCGNKKSYYFGVPKRLKCTFGADGIDLSYISTQEAFIIVACSTVAISKIHFMEKYLLWTDSFCKE